MTLVGSATIMVQGVATDCYKASFMGEGTFSATEGNVVETGTAYFRKSDMANVNSTMTVTTYAGGLVLTQITYTNTSIPVTPYQFPLYVGQSWSSSYDSTVKTTNFTSINPTQVNATNTTHVSDNYNVASESVVAVTAGSYDAYDVHSTSSSGYTDDYYSPQVENSVQTVSHFSNGTVSTSVSLQDFSAWAYQSSITVTENSNTYNVGLFADATISNKSENNTAITFQVNGTSGTSGRASITVPKGLNRTLVQVYVDNNLETLTVTPNSTSFQLYFTFGLTTHTVTLLYASNTLTPATLSTYLFFVGLVVAALVVMPVVFILLRRRSTPPPAVS